MSDKIITTQNLNFGFNKHELIVQNLNLNVEKGSIYGFLGPNGAGKTTTIRLLLGLLLPSNGEVQLFGKNLSANRLEIFSKIGALIEQPSLYEHLSGFDNLAITQKLKNVSKNRIAEVLEIVQLTEAVHKKVNAYSLGMKQRLGLAVALLSEPELLILDEPVNGLDPNGMFEIRELLLKLNKDFGTTIFLSSHLLAEIEKMATHVGIINNGKMIFEGKIQDLNELNDKTALLALETSDNATAFQLLQEKFVVQKNENLLQMPFRNKEQAAQINQLLIENHLRVYQLFVQRKDLEELFLELTQV